MDDMRRLMVPRPAFRRLCRLALALAWMGLLPAGRSGESDGDPRTLPYAVATWYQGEGATAFRSAQGAFLQKVRADSRMGFSIAGLDLDMVFVAPGHFTLGDDGGEDDEQPETPAHISRGFWIGKFEVTQQEWVTIMRLKPMRYRGGKLPVTMISWNAAMEFCRKLTGEERSAGRLPKGYVYRLPTEAEWEYACRLGVEGHPPTVTLETGWYAPNALQKTHPVGEKKPNALGLYDMFGNVSEWCADWFGKYPGKTVTDYTGPRVGDFRVTRGGNAFDLAYGCRPSYRTGSEPNVRTIVIGMRLVLGPELE